MEHCVSDLGFKAVMIRPAPYIENKKLQRPGVRPVLGRRGGARLPDRRAPVLVRRHAVERRVARSGSTGRHVRRPDKGLALRQGLGNALDVMVAMGWFVAGGICERFPKLTVVFLEGSGGWCAPMLERFDHHLEVFGSRYQTHAAVGGLQAPVLHQLRSRRGGARLYREQQVRRRRPDRVGVGLPPSRRQDPRRRRRARGGDRDPDRDPQRVIRGGSAADLYSL